MFKEIIYNEYSDKFKYIIFAIPDEKSSRKTLAAFRSVFEAPKSEKIEGSGVIQFSTVKDQYGFLTNSSKHGFKLKGKEWPSATHYIEAQKFTGTTIGIFNFNRELTLNRRKYTKCQNTTISRKIST